MVGSHLILVVLAVEGDRESVLMAARYCSQGVSVDCPMPDKRLRTSSNHLGGQLEITLTIPAVLSLLVPFPDH